jgi:4-hydroxy-3-polyprenylbenzoate decarboxylase
MRYILSIGGASGSIYGVRLLQELKKYNHEVHLIVTEMGRKILERETHYTYENIKKMADTTYDNSDLLAPPASGSFQHDGMIISPCSTKTLSAIANGFGDTLTARIAICSLKEGRKLVLVIRETPFDLSVIKNMLAAKENGAVILPAAPAFYHKPSSIEGIVNFIVGKVLDQFGLEHKLFKRWG